MNDQSINPLKPISPIISIGQTQNGINKQLNIQDADNKLTSIIAERVKASTSDKEIKIVLIGHIVRFGVVVEGQAYQVSVNVGEFLKNRHLLEAHFNSPMNQNLLNPIYPKRLQELIDETAAKATPGIPNNFFGIPESELNTIKNYYNTNKVDFFESLTDHTFLDRKVTGLSRSLVSIADSSKHKGVYVLLKEHGNVDQLGIGASKRATYAVNIETGKIKVWLSAQSEGVLDNEIDANLLAHQYPERFAAADNFVFFEGRMRIGAEDRTSKTGTRYDTDKIGSIVDHQTGGDLLKFRDNVPPPSFEERLDMMIKVFDHLSFLHDVLKHTHNDIKIDNIAIMEDGVKITDFGNTMATGEDQGICGTPPFIAPEVYESRAAREKISANPAVDIWATGLLLLEMFGDFNNYWVDNFPRTDPYNLARISLLKDTASDLVDNYLIQTGNRQLYYDMVSIINDSCLNFDPDKRKTAAEIRDQLISVRNKLKI